MELILLSGGSGKRLWPLSNDARSKQFLKVLKTSEGQYQSMIQRVWAQLKKVGLAESALIATSKSQVDLIQNHLGKNLDLVIEPSRRDTFAAIALAASYLYTQKGISLDEVVTVLPVDVYVQEAFFEKIKDLEQIVQESKADVVLMGVKPTESSSKYGYIVPVNKTGNEEFFTVGSFKEKPSTQIAEELIQQGALWNCGVFAFKLRFIIEYLVEIGLPVDYDELLLNFEKINKISFDYEIVERIQNLVVTPFDGEWKDLGTWNTLTEEMSTQQIGNGIVSKDCTNTHVINELDFPITVLGLKNVIVAASADGILVSDKESSPSIKEVMKDIHARPMYEERRWGWYRVLDYTKINGGQEVLTKRICITAGKNLSYQFHHKRSEVWTVIKGEGIFVLDNKFQVVRPGDVLQIKAGARHGVKAVTDLEIIEVQAGDEIIEEDIVRIFMTWHELEDHCYAIK